jgi:hypothetical protein
MELKPCWLCLKKYLRIHLMFCYMNVLDEDTLLQNGIDLALLQQNMGKRCTETVINHDYSVGVFASCILSCTGRLVSGDFYFASFCYKRRDSYVVISFRSDSSEKFEFMETLFHKSERGFYPSHAGSSTVMLQSPRLIVEQIISSLIFYQTLPDRTYQCLIRLTPTFWKSSVYGDIVEFFDIKSAYEWKLLIRGAYVGKLPDKKSERNLLKVVIENKYTLTGAQNFTIKAVLCDLNESFNKDYLVNNTPSDTQIGTVVDVGDLASELGKMLLVLKGILKDRLPTLSQRISNMLELVKKKKPL